MLRHAALSLGCFASLWSMATLRAAEPKPKAAPSYTAAQLDYFEKHVRPLFLKRCTECHGDDPKEVAGGLSLLNRAGWVEGGDSGPAVVVGKPAESLLLKAVKYDGHLEMPPDERLPAADVAIIENWIKMGAPDPRDGKKPVVKEAIDVAAGRKFWAFEPLLAMPAPSVQDIGWATTDVDRFVLSKLESAGLRPNGDVEPALLLRRVYFVLTGLPPTPDEVKAFEANPTAEALAEVVDRLLASPQYGETWGRHWLDVARYADSNGNDFNATFHDAYRYRNFVIKSFQNDKPFPEFIRQQIAGDLLPAKDRESREENIVATGFLALGTKMLSERDKERLALDIVDEQVDTIGRAFLGLTLGCARCHDHKFDPVPTADYYAMAGILHSTETIQGESQQYVSDLVRTDLHIEPAHAEALAKHKASVDALKKEIATTKRELTAARNPNAAPATTKTATGKTADAKTTGAKASRKDDIRQPKDLLGIVVDNSQAKIVGDWKASSLTPRYVGEGYIHDQKTGKGEKSITFTPDLPAVAEYELRISYSHSEGRDPKVPVTIRHHRGTTVVYLNQELRPDVDGLFHSLGRFHFDAGGSNYVKISTEGTTEHVIADAVQFILVDLLDKPVVAQAGEKAGTAETSETVKLLEEKMKTLEAKLKELDKQAPAPPNRALAVRDMPKPADIAIRIRGEHRNKGAVVPRGFLQVLMDKPAKLANPATSGRVELADWIVNQHNPLTARVMVNRIWSHVFGEGVVRSVDNFGKLGDRPSHPNCWITWRGAMWTAAGVRRRWCAR